MEHIHIAFDARSYHTAWRLKGEHGLEFDFV